MLERLKRLAKPLYARYTQWAKEGEIRTLILTHPNPHDLDSIVCDYLIGDCALFARSTAKRYFGAEYEPTHAWTFHQTNEMVYADPEMNASKRLAMNEELRMNYNSRFLEKVRNADVNLTPGTIVGIFFDRTSHHEDARRTSGRDDYHTHVGVIGFDEKRQMHYLLHLFGKKLEVQYLDIGGCSDLAKKGLTFNCVYAPKRKGA